MAMILAVDDHAINREILATLLGYFGHEVIQASDGAQALVMAGIQRPDLIITDILMPSMNGIEFAQRVRATPLIAHTPIIFYTATYRVAEARVLAQSCGVTQVIAKPAEPQAILDAVVKALGSISVTAAMPEDANADQSILGAKLPSYVRDLGELHSRLRRTLDQAVAQAEFRGTSSIDSDAVSYSFHSLSLRLAALLELDIALASERDPEEMMTLFCRAAQDIMNCKHAVIGIIDAQSGTLQRFAARGLNEDTQSQFSTIDPLAGLLGSVVNSGLPHRAHEAGDASTRLGLPGFHPAIRSLLAVPVPARSAVALSGWIYFADRLGTGAFADEDEQFAVTLAAQFALAYGNLALFEQVQQHAEKLEIEVTARKLAQEELTYRVNHDQTTGLPRFALIEEFFQRATADTTDSNRRVFVLYIDIDRFQTINETRGRLVGDQVLRAVAGRLNAAAGTRGKVAHIASDEFAVVAIADGGVADQIAFAEKVRKSVEEPIRYDEHSVYVTCSVGVTCWPDNGTSSQDLVRQAEAAMLHAKRDGRNAVSAFAKEQKQALEHRAALGLRLRDAIREEQLVVHYQPQVSGQNWQVIGFEALVRWQSPEFGLLLPMRFLDVAEDLGLSVDIGNFVLESVCHQARAWFEAGEKDFSISLNVSSLQMQRSGFVSNVSAALRRWTLPPKFIELELTEGMMTGNVERVIGTMRALKALGVQLALDDFGTGYSSLNYLRRFPLDKLKIDQSFVRDISTDPGAAGICRSIITLGHQLGMTVLAEGVETAAQATYLMRAGCNKFQGFYFGKAMPAEQAFETLRQRYIVFEDIPQ